MAFMPPIMPFLRPLGLPRPATIRQFLRFSTSSITQAPGSAKAGIEDRNLTASRTASATYPPEGTKSQPRPKESRASRRTAHPPKKREYLTRQPSHSQPEVRKLVPEPVEPLPAAQCAPNLPYFVTRTKSRELPIYLLRKRGGNLKQTRLKKIDGSIEALRDQLKTTLALDVKDCVINPITKHIILKGHHKPQIERFLRERLF